MESPSASTPKRPRSPSYPSISLEKAVERAEVLYKHEGKYLAPIDSILGHWGYTARSGRALRQLAALKKFGLAVEEGSRADRQIKLSELGLRIVMPDSPERASALREAALTPAIHQELKAKYQDGLPSDATVRWYLKSEREFTDSAANELVAEYRETMRFAGLNGHEEPADGDDGEDKSVSTGDIDPSQDIGMAENGAQAQAPPLPPLQQDDPKPPPAPKSELTAPTLREVSIPLAGTAWVKVVGEFPITESAWDQMMTMLAAMKPGLTRADD